MQARVKILYKKRSSPLFWEILYDPYIFNPLIRNFDHGSCCQNTAHAKLTMLVQDVLGVHCQDEVLQQAACSITTSSWNTHERLGSAII